MKPRSELTPRRFSPRPALCGTGILFLSLLLTAGTARAQLTHLWPETARLLAPAGGFRGFESTIPLPVAGWSRGHSARPGMPGVSPITDPLLWLPGELPLVFLAEGGSLLYRDRLEGRTHNDFHGHTYDLALSVPVTRHRLDLMSGWRHEGVDSDAFLTGGSGDIDRSVTEGHLWIGSRLRLPGLSAIAAVGQKEGSAGLTECAVAIRARMGGAVSFSLFGSREAVADAIDLRYRDAGAHLIVPAWRSAIGIRIEGRLHGWSIRFRGDAGETTGRGDSEPRHRLVPRLKPRLAEAQIATPNDIWQVAAGIERSRHRAELRSLGLRYARILLDDRREWVRIGYRPPGTAGRWRFWGGYSDTNEEAEGGFEFWPFTPTIIDLLGLRRSADAEAELSVLSFGVRHRFPRQDPAGGEIGVDLHHLHSDGSLESWEPLILGLGKWNILTDELLYSSAQILDLGARGRIVLGGRLVLEAGAAQLVPLAVQKRARPAGAPPSQPGPPGAEAVWGGLRWWFAIHIAPRATISDSSREG